MSAQAMPVIDGLSANTLKCDSVNPYVISSITQKDGNIVSLGGYRLSAAFDEMYAKSSVSVKKSEIAGY